MTTTAEQLETTVAHARTPQAATVGRAVAKAIFDRRERQYKTRPVEQHLSERALAAACALAAEVALQREVEPLRKALRDLVERCDGAEGVRADGSNVDTLAAHAALGDLAE